MKLTDFMAKLPEGVILQIEVRRDPDDAHPHLAASFLHADGRRIVTCTAPITDPEGLETMILGNIISKCWLQ